VNVYIYIYIFAFLTCNRGEMCPPDFSLKQQAELFDGTPITGKNISQSKSEDLF
jgi:hypothetical protein